MKVMDRITKEIWSEIFCIRIEMKLKDLNHQSTIHLQISKETLWTHSFSCTFSLDTWMIETSKSNTHRCPPLIKQCHLDPINILICDIPSKRLINKGSKGDKRSIVITFEKKNYIDYMKKLMVKLVIYNQLQCPSSKQAYKKRQSCFRCSEKHNK